LAYIALCSLAILIHQPVWMKMHKLPLIFFIRDEFIRNLIVFSISYIVAHAMDTFRQNQLMKDIIIEIQQKNLAGQLETLKQQINPHFFFNSMNTLSGLAKEDPNKTVEFIDKLSLIFRYVLDIQEKNLVSLSEELRFAKAYIFLLEVRFAEKLVIEINLDENETAMVPSLCSQLLLENIIKHNSMSNHNPVKIEFYKEPGYFVVRNTLALKKDTTGAGIGLKNLDARSRLLIGKQIEINASADHFMVKIPFKSN
jgi:LytS/YehU family sensor histidine kinase